jgi:hypothetical protein
MIELFTLVRHTPFWAIPLIVIGLEFAYIFWLRKKKKTAYFFCSFALVGLLAVSFYWWAGGPDKSVQFLKKMRRDHLE